ncbi:hypothetical protein E2A64_05590 [Pseudohoeflea suaedae]|uniref:Uncharacterized protein n=1 Tax=Pseudohoeflea suaedae TaxID=877384 RepID=A0A4R5PNE3_9HYPH|nr:hypothetical protein [Pseudohoeflea suaedae]TDH38574.1 hypothetical protein E2A64_05590 [Pseudohoeflea suaedae]
MTRKALLTAADARRLTEAAKASGCAIVVKSGEDTITIIPDGHSQQSAILDRDHNEPPVTLEGWRKRRLARGLT